MNELVGVRVDGVSHQIGWVHAGHQVGDIQHRDALLSIKIDYFRCNWAALLNGSHLWKDNDNEFVAIYLGSLMKLQ